MKRSTEHNVRFTSSEVGSLWASYMADSMGICTLKYFLEKVEDSQIRPIVRHALGLAEKHLRMVSALFESEAIPIPVGFTDEDVNCAAPRLFSDSFLLVYVQKMSVLGIESNAVALGHSTRRDVREFYMECLNASVELNDKATELLLEKGLYVRAPYITPAKQVEFVQKQHFLAGYFGKKRPLLAMEINHLYTNSQANALGRALVIGFAQVGRSQEVRKYFVKGSGMAAEYIRLFGEFLRESDLPIPMTWDSDITDSTVAPFSDKLMLFHVLSLTAAGVGIYGASMASSLRHDLGGMYGRVMAEALHYAEDGMNLMIENGWMEKPPGAVDRMELADL